MRNVRFPVKTAAVAIAAALLSPLVADWTAPGAGCRAAFDVLSGYQLPTAGCQFSLWRWLVRLVGWNVEALGVVSFAGAIVCAGFSEQQADFAHAVLCLKSRADSRYGTMRLKELADASDEDAMRFLKRR